MADKLPFFASEWEACDPEGFAARADRPETVLETISRVRLADVQAAAAVMPLEELKAKVEAEAGPAIDFYERLSRVDGRAGGDQTRLAVQSMDRSGLHRGGARRALRQGWRGRHLGETLSPRPPRPSLRDWS
jgi:hypothetical protein